MNKKANILKNVIYGFGSQLITLVLGIIVPRIMIKNYGSDINGLLSTISQIFVYMALLEAGIGQAARNALYKPLSVGDKASVSYYASVAQDYYRKITVYYILGVVGLSAACPFILKTDVDHGTVFGVILFEGLSGAISFYFIETINCVLGADGKSYINNALSVANRILSYSVKIIMAANGVNVILLQAAYCAITIGNVAFYRFYFKKHYSWIRLKSENKKEKLKDRNYYIISEIAWTIFSSTDLIILSTFVSTKEASVYAVYNLVFSSLNRLLNSIYSSITYLLGQTYHTDLKAYEKLHDAYHSIFLGTMTVFMCTAYVLIMPFIRLYTKGITDVDYNNAKLPLMFCLVQILSWSRYVAGNLTAIAGYANKTSRVSIIEAIINVMLSLLLVKKYEIIGVLFATVAALPIKIVYLTWLSDKVIMKRSIKKSILIIAVNYLMFAITVFLTPKLSLQIHSYLSLLLFGCAIFAAIGIIAILINITVNRECLEIIHRFIRLSKTKEHA